MNVLDARSTVIRNGGELADVRMKGVKHSVTRNDGQLHEN